MMMARATTDILTVSGAPHISVSLKPGSMIIIGNKM